MINLNQIEKDIINKIVNEEDIKYYKKHLSEPWFSLVKKGEKKVEGRLNKGDFKEIKVNDIVIFYNNDDECKVKIIKKDIYKSFEDLIINKKIKNIIPTVNRVNNAVKIYREYYSEYDEKKYGVVGLTIEIIN